MKDSYTKNVMKYFLNPKNMGEIKNPDGVGKVGNMVCGDITWIFIKIDKKKNIIKDIKFKTLGCAAAISTSSVLTEMAKWKTIEEALKIKEMDIVKKLGGLPEPKIHCSLLAASALREAIYDYFKSSKMPISASLEKTHKIIMKEFNELEKRHRKK